MDHHGPAASPILRSHVQGWGTKLFTDGLHFTVEGNQHAFEAIMAVVNATYPELA